MGKQTPLNRGWGVRLLGWLGLTPAVVKHEDDGLTRRLVTAGGAIDPPYSQLAEDQGDALEAWRRNPLARRIVALVTAYVVGDGIKLSATDPALHAFTARFWRHDRNQLLLRQGPWCDELTRSGELFIALFTNKVDGISHMRALPAVRVRARSWACRVRTRRAPRRRAVGSRRATRGAMAGPAGRRTPAAGKVRRRPRGVLQVHPRRSPPLR